MTNKMKTLKRERARLRKSQNPQQVDFKKMDKVRTAKTEYWKLKKRGVSVKKPAAAKKEAKKPKPEKKEKKKKEKKPELEVIEEEPELEVIEDEDEPELEVIEEEPEIEEIDEELEDLYTYDEELDDDELDDDED